MRLTVQDLSGGYKDLKVIEGLSLQVEQSEIVTVLGANGAGKTTLLRLISGMLSPTGGRLVAGDDDITGLRAPVIARRGIAHVPENRLVFPGLTVTDNLHLGAWTRRREALEDDFDRCFTLFPRLAERRTQAAGTLSGGEQQMVAIARGLMARPSLLLLDEPSLGLAPRLISEIFAALAQVRDDAGMTMVLVEQNVRAAIKIADRGYVMERGEIVTSGTVEGLKSDPAVTSAYLGHGAHESDAADTRTQQQSAT